MSPCRYGFARERGTSITFFQGRIGDFMGGVEPTPSADLNAVTQELASGSTTLRIEVFVHIYVSGSSPASCRLAHFAGPISYPHHNAVGSMTIPRRNAAKSDTTETNATTYGIYAEMNRQELPKGEKERVRLWGLGGEARAVAVHAPEEAGAFFFAPLAALIAGAARLMLATVERLVTDAGGTYAFCDTDSMAIVANERGGTLATAAVSQAARILSWTEAEAIRQRFTALNPYDRTAVPGSVLRLEAMNGVRGEPAPLDCLAISAKRYALFRSEGRGPVTLLKRSEHGLGHLLNPLDPDAEDRDWVDAVWRVLVAEERGRAVALPRWARQPAIGRVTVSSPALRTPFDTLNAGKPYAEEVKPFNFLLTAHVKAFGRPTSTDLGGSTDSGRFHLIAPYVVDPRQWLRMAWIDRYSGKRYAITTEGETGGRGLARVKRYDEVIADYRGHREMKSAGPDGRPCRQETRGVLRRLPVTVSHVVYVGKESNLLDEAIAGLLHDDEHSTTYGDPGRDEWIAMVLPRLRQVPTATLVKATGLSRSAIKNIKAGVLPHAKNRVALRKIATGPQAAS